jgi:hypothetical protein
MNIHTHSRYCAEVVTIAATLMTFGLALALWISR